MQEELLILPFDHRGTMTEKLYGIKGREPTAEETAAVVELKRIVYEGFQLSLKNGVRKEKTGILVDEQFGLEILKEAKAKGITIAQTVEKSGQEEFHFEYANWREHIKNVMPDYAKVLVRLNPEGDAGLNERQLGRLKELNDFLHSVGVGYLFELIVAATPTQMASADGSKEKFDAEIRPKLMVKGVKMIQDHGIEPQVWKLEGVDRKEDAEALVRQVKANGRTAGIITLGRGENKDKVCEWLKVGAKIQGVIGFAVGRTVFWDAIKGFKEKTLTREQAVEMVARNYKEFVDLWEGEKNG